MIYDAFQKIKSLVGDIPFQFIKDSEVEHKKGEEVTSTSSITKSVVLKDGTYASITSVESSGSKQVSNEGKIEHLRKLISSGDILLGTTVSVTLTKLALKAKTHLNQLAIEAALVSSGVGKLAETKRGTRVGVHSDCLSRLSQCLRLLLDAKSRESLIPIFLKSSNIAFKAFVAKQKLLKIKQTEENKKSTISQADDLIQFRQLRSHGVQGGIEVDLMDADDISRAIGSDGTLSDSSKLKHVYQLTGQSDPVYAEASVTVHDYDIIIEILIVNRTSNTLTNLTVELATMGDLKLVERPQPHNIGPNDERRVRANIKVSSTETSHIFGTIVFDHSSSAQKTYVNLNDIQLDIMDYIRPAECKNEEFRSMWAEFEWENKVIF
jgi:coatomer subunit beta